MLNTNNKGFISMERYELEKAEIERTAQSAEEYERRIKELCNKIKV